MRCCGLTKQGHRCKRDTRFVFCGLHLFQPFVVLVAAAAGLKALHSTYKDVIAPAYEGTAMGQPWYVGTWSVDFDRSYREWPELDPSRPIPPDTLRLMRDVMLRARVEIQAKEGVVRSLDGTRYSERVSASGTQTQREQTEVGSWRFEVVSSSADEVKAKIVSVAPGRISCPKTHPDLMLVMRREKDDVYMLGPISACSSSSSWAASSVEEKVVMVRLYLVRSK
jgi:hypothetical protein